MFLLLFGMYWPPGSQRVAQCLLASVPGMPKNPILACWAAGRVPTGKVSNGYWAARPWASSFMPWSNFRDPALEFNQPFALGSAVFWNPASAAGVVAYLAL